MTTPTTTLAQRQRAFAKYLMADYPKLALKGLPARSACAIAGNATQENQCRAVTTGALDHGSNGVLQWRLDRLTALQNFGVKNFGRWDTLEAQAAFCLYELRKDFPALDTQLHAGVYSLETLTANFCDVYERPAKATEGLGFVPGVGGGHVGRINYAYDTQALLAHPVATPPAAHATAGSVVVVAGAAAGGAHWLGGPWWLAPAILAVGAAAIFAIYTHFKNNAALASSPPVGPLAKSTPVQKPAASPPSPPPTPKP